MIIFSSVHRSYYQVKGKVLAVATICCCPIIVILLDPTVYSKGKWNNKDAVVGGEFLKTNNNPFVFPLLSPCVLCKGESDLYARYTHHTFAAY